MNSYDVIMKNYDVIIIGGGAAGFMAASFLEQKKVLIIEKNHQLMKKLLITGKGRCNLTNNCDMETLLRNIPKNSVFMRSALTRFTPADTIAFFESSGVPLKTERGGRVFPVSDRAGDIVSALRRNCKAEIIVDRAKELIIENNIVKGVKCGKSSYFAPKIIVATGGMSYPKTGSTGDGYELAKKAGHSITAVKPALVPLETGEVLGGNYLDLAGLSLKNVRLTLKENNKTLFCDQGEMLFTHFGVSGPLVLSASSYIGNPAECTLHIDFKPALDEKTLDARILRDFAENKNRQFKNSLSALLPEKMISVFVKQSAIEPDKQVNEITKKERRKLLQLFKNFTLNVKAFRPIDEAVITDGGVSVKEIDPKTMQSKLVEGLYFAGEIIDVTGFTGGFNLQIAFSTAYAAVSATNC